jgi:Protein of unknown function (DUF2442)
MTPKHFTLTSVEALLPATLDLHFADGAHMTVDLTALIRRHPVLKLLGDAAVFAQARLGEWGTSVVWADDDNLALAADNLRACAVEQAGECSHELIWNWMARHGLTLDTAAMALGLSRRMLAYYRSGAKPVPRTVALACVGWEMEQAQRTDQLMVA